MSTPSPANTAATATSAAAETVKPSNFLRQIIEHDLDKGTYATRRWAGTPGDAAHHAQGEPDPAKIRTRFPPEPNGYLHVGHAKSICINFGLARDYGGVCHLRFDDTNPEKEDTEYVNSIIDAVKWLGFDWTQIGQAPGSAAPYQASDYFDFMYRAAEYLIEAGHAYVDEQTAEQMRVNRGDFSKPGVDSPFRSRSAADAGPPRVIAAPRSDIALRADSLNPTNDVLDRIGRHCLTLMQTHRIDAIHYSVLEIQLAALAKVQGGCERIALTPVPFAYSLLLHRTALVFCITLPFALAGSLDWWTLLPVLLVAYTFFGLEALGHQLEEPFGLEPNALPLAAMLRTVERDMLFLLGDTDLPEPVLARNNVLS